MSFPKIDGQNGLSIGGVGGLDGTAGFVSDVALGKEVGGHGSIDLLLRGGDRAIRMRCNAIELSSALTHALDRRVEDIIKSL